MARATATPTPTPTPVPIVPAEPADEWAGLKAYPVDKFVKAGRPVSPVITAWINNLLVPNGVATADVSAWDAKQRAKFRNTVRKLTPPRTRFEYGTVDGVETLRVTLPKGAA